MPSGYTTAVAAAAIKEATGLPSRFVEAGRTRVCERAVGRT